MVLEILRFLGPPAVIGAGVGVWKLVKMWQESRERQRLAELDTQKAELAVKKQAIEADAKMDEIEATTIKELFEQAKGDRKRIGDLERTKDDCSQALAQANSLNVQSVSMLRQSELLHVETKQELVECKRDRATQGKQLAIQGRQLTAQEHQIKALERTLNVRTSDLTGRFAKAEENAKVEAKAIARREVRKALSDPHGLPAVKEEVDEDAEKGKKR